MNTYVPVFNFSQLTKFCISLLSDFQTKMQIVLNKNVFLLKIMNEKNKRFFYVIYLYHLQEYIKMENFHFMH